MSVKPNTVKTIDNLGEEVSRKYVENQQALEQAFLDDFVGDLTKVVSQSPYQIHEKSEFQQKFNTQQKNEPWADFLPPPGFFSSMRRLFTYQLIPSMGTPEKIELLLDTLRKVRKKKKSKKQSSQDFLEEKEEEEQKDALENLFTLLLRLDKDLDLVNMLRNQYHKG